MNSRPLVQANGASRGRFDYEPLGAVDGAVLGRC